MSFFIGCFYQIYRYVKSYLGRFDDGILVIFLHIKLVLGLWFVLTEHNAAFMIYSIPVKLGCIYVNMFCLVSNCAGKRLN